MKTRLAGRGVLLISHRIQSLRMDRIVPRRGLRRETERTRNLALGGRYAKFVEAQESRKTGGVR